MTVDLNRFKDKAQNLLKDNADKIEKGVGKAEKFAKSKSSKTGKHDEKIDKVAGRIRGLIPDDRPGPTPHDPPPAG